MRHRSTGCDGAGSAWGSVPRAIALLGAFLVLPGAGPAAGAKPRVSEAPTFAKDVAVILQKRCEACHRPDQVGPFPLQTYEQARKRAKDIAAVTADGSMPPWKPTAGFGPKLKYEHRLTAAEVRTLRDWAAAGAPKGKDADMPPPVKYPDGWALGTPDLVLEAAEDFEIPASGPDTYRCFVIPTGLKRDTFVAAVEYRPSNRRVVHHLQAFVDNSGGARDLDREEPGPGYTSFSGPGVEAITDLGGWTPGNDPTRLPEGIGRMVPAGSDLVIQVHYHPSGKPERERTKVGIYFSREPVKRTLHWANASSYDFKLPAGNSNVEVKASWFVPVDVEALAVTPHMHMLGRDLLMTVTVPGCKPRDLIKIEDWDPAWQNTYYFEKPVTLPKGSTVNLVAHFDNSSHARNPHKPPKAIRWGHGANDEMCTGYIGVVKKGQDLTQAGEKDDLYDTLYRQVQKNRFREYFKREQRAAERANR